MTHRHHRTAGIRRLDPVDGERLAAAWSDSAARTALFQEITAMPVDTETPAPVVAPPRRHRRRLALAAGLAVAAAALVVGGGVLVDRTPAYAIRQLDNGVIEIDWLADHRDGTDLAAELRQFGIDVDIVATPASPSAVGRIWGFAAGELKEVPQGITWGEDGTDEVFTWTIDPAVFRGPLTLEVGVKAKHGERYVIAEEVFESGEVLGGLHCALGEPLRATDVAARLGEVGVTPVWNVAAPIPGDPTAMKEETVQEVPDGHILWGYALDEATVSFTVLPDGVMLDPANFSPRLSDLPCTAEQSQRWN